MDPNPKPPLNVPTGNLASNQNFLNTANPAPNQNFLNIANSSNRFHSSNPAPSAQNLHNALNLRNVPNVQTLQYFTSLSSNPISSNLQNLRNIPDQQNMLNIQQLTNVQYLASLGNGSMISPNLQNLQNVPNAQTVPIIHPLAALYYRSSLTDGQSFHPCIQFSHVPNILASSRVSNVIQSCDQSPSISSPHIQGQEESGDEGDDSEEDTFDGSKLNELIYSHIEQWKNEMETDNKLSKCYLDAKLTTELARKKMAQIKRDTTQLKQREMESAIMSLDTTRMALQEAKFWNAQKRRISRKTNLTSDKTGQLHDDELLSLDSSDTDEFSSDSSDDDDLFFSDCSDDEFVLPLIINNSVPRLESLRVLLKLQDQRRSSSLSSHRGKAKKTSPSNRHKAKVRSSSRWSKTNN